MELTLLVQFIVSAFGIGVAAWFLRTSVRVIRDATSDVEVRISKVLFGIGFTLLSLSLVLLVTVGQAIKAERISDQVIRRIDASN